MPLAIVVIIYNVLAKLNVEQAKNRVEDPLKINYAGIVLKILSVFVKIKIL